MPPTDPTPEPPTDAERLREIADRWRPTAPSHAVFLAAFADRLEARDARLATLERLAEAAGNPAIKQAACSAKKRQLDAQENSRIPEWAKIVGIEVIACVDRFFAALKEAQP